MQKIEYIAVDKLKNHPDNPRLIKDKMFKILCESIKENPAYFETRPILCNKDMVVFAGNMRLRAAREIGLKEVPAAIMDVDAEKEKELMVRDNVENGLWDYDLLANHFDALELEGWGLDLGLDFFGGEEVEDCNRCKELKKQCEGHKKKSGHSLD